ncbi:hypothetical protein ACWDRR_40955, partial [Kitasatospora sp. NPDC003701]
MDPPPGLRPFDKPWRADGAGCPAAVGGRGRLRPGHKATLYRRWGGVDGLVADALTASADQPWPLP